MPGRLDWIDFEDEVWSWRDKSGMTVTGNVRGKGSMQKAGKKLADTWAGSARFSLGPSRDPVANSKGHTS